jgi:prepilin-type N-terminal cleavage/methylation domain-containing protein
VRHEAEWTVGINNGHENYLADEFAVASDFLTFESVVLIPMSFPLISRSRGVRRAFTLIELLTVIAIIGILAAITLGVVKGVENRAAISRCRTELATLAQALEAYRKQYGDYPQTGSSAVTIPVSAAAATASSVEGRLFNALLGKVGPKLDAIQGKQFIEASKFSLQTTNLPTAGNTTSVANAFMDPWGRMYLYYYRTAAAATWTQPAFILLSAGPDGNLGITVNSATGVIAETDNSQAADNLYTNR